MTTTDTIRTRMNAGDWGLLVTLSILWGGSFFFVEVTVGHLPALTVVVARVGLAAAILLAVLVWRGSRVQLTAPVLRAFLGMGLLNNVIPFTLIVWGQQSVASGLAAILNATTPLFAVLVAHCLTVDERLTPLRGVGVVAGFAGVVLMLGADLVGGSLGALGAQVAILAAAFSYALAGVYGRRFRRLGVPPLATAAGQVTASALMLLPVMLWVDRPWTLPMPSDTVLGAVAGLAALSTALAYVLYFRLLERAGATNLLLVTFLVPVSAILLGVVLLHERLGPAQIAGMVLIGLGLAAIDGRLLRR